MYRPANRSIPDHYPVGTTGGFINTRCEITVLRTRACLGTGQSCVPDCRKTWLQKRMLIIALRERRRKLRAVRVSVTPSFSSLSRRSTYSRFVYPNYISRRTRDSALTHTIRDGTETISLVRSPRSSARKLQNADFRGSADDGSANPRRFSLPRELIATFPRLGRGIGYTQRPR